MKTIKTKAEGLPHIGNMLRQHVKKRRLMLSVWSRLQGVGDTTIAKYCKNEDMRVHTLLSISKTLQYNFLAEIAATLPADLPPRAENPLQAQVEELKAENEKLKTQLDLMKELFGGGKGN